jgi:hypothetical protein
MENGLEVKVKLEESKSPVLPVELSKKAHANLLKVQSRFKKKHGSKISLKAIANKMLETATI